MSVDWIERSRSLRLLAKSFVDGCWIEPSGQSIEKFSPRDGASLYTFGASDAREINDSVRSARRAFDDGRWAELSAERRKRILVQLASLIERDQEELALLESLDVGKPISEALSLDVPLAAAIVRFSAESADKVYGPVYAVDSSSLSYQLHRPLGVVGGIVGWNFPLVLAAAKVGPVLAAGNSLVLKPSELTPLSSTRLVELAVEAGVPEGVFNLIQGGAELGSGLASHGDIDLVTFTGSSQTGRKLLVASGHSNMKRLVLECGGKAPNIVFDDAPDLEAVATGIATRAFWNQGQVCTASSRLLVQEGIREALLEKVVEQTLRLRMGDPLLPDTNFGALISHAHQEKVLRYVETGMREGAKLRLRAPDPSSLLSGGSYVAPVILDEVAPGSQVAQEEIFGPVLSAISFKDEHEAVAIANGTIFGLSAMLWTKDVSRAHRVAHRIKAGWITVNATGSPRGGPGPGVLNVEGHKESGFGSEGGTEGIGHYLSKTAMQWFV